jgi:hypothetical protein
MSDDEDNLGLEVDGPSLQPEIDIFYKKSASHRVMKADGAWAGITPQLDIQFALYNDLQPMPSRIRHRITPEGQLSPVEVSRDVEIGIERQVIATVVMNPIVAMQFVNVLQQMIDQVHKNINAITNPSPQSEKIETS